MYLKKSIICAFTVAILLAMCGNIVYAHGPVYEMKSLDSNIVRISLKWSGEKDKGIAVSFYNLSNGKTLNIGYSAKKGRYHTSYLDYDLTGAIPPLRVILVNTDDPEWRPFSDIRGIEQEEYIWHLHDAGIVNGKPDGRFEPESAISRAELAAMIVRALNLKNTGTDTKNFKDIDKSWAKNDIIIAAQHGIVSGFGDGSFGPSKPVTIAEISSVIYRSFCFKTAGDGKYYRLKTGKWYSKYVKRMFDAGILNTGDSIYGDFDEMSCISRADCAMMLSRAISTY